MYLLAGLGIMIPIGVFVAASTRIGATMRERRFAAMRLVGATPRQVALAAATEAAAAAAVGGLAGLALALLLRTRAADIAVAGYSTFPADLSPPRMRGRPPWSSIAGPGARRGGRAGRDAASGGDAARRPPPPGARQAVHRRLIPLAVVWVELAVAVQMGDRLTEDGKLAALGVGFAASFWGS